MISLFIPYFLTFLGLMTGSGQDFVAFALFMTFIGVVWTLIRGLAKHVGLKILLIQEAIHGVLWFVFHFKPELLGQAIGIVIGLAVAIPLAIAAYVYLIGPLFSGTFGNDSPTPDLESPIKEGGNELLPQYIYDGNNQVWSRVYRSPTGECRYRCEADGREIYIHHANVRGSFANTSEGSFHWY